MTECEVCGDKILEDGYFGTWVCSPECAEALKEEEE